MRQRNTRYILAAIALGATLSTACETPHEIQSVDGITLSARWGNNNHTAMTLDNGIPARETETYRLALHGQDDAAPTDDAQNPAQPNASAAETMALEYSIDGADAVSIEATERDELSTIYRLMGDVRGGHRVTITPRQSGDEGADTMVFSTTSVEDVIVWTRRMVRRGYAVTIEYNPDTGIYRCTAILNKKKKRSK